MHLSNEPGTNDSTSKDSILELPEAWVNNVGYAVTNSLISTSLTLQLCHCVDLSSRLTTYPVH